MQIKLAHIYLFNFISYLFLKNYFVSLMNKVYFVIYVVLITL